MTTSLHHLNYHFEFVSNLVCPSQNVLRFASGIHQKFNVKRFVPGIQEKMQADTAARVRKCVFEIRHLKQRIPGLVGATCG